MGDNLLQINRYEHEVNTTKSELSYAQKQIDRLSAEKEQKVWLFDVKLRMIYCI